MWTAVIRPSTWFFAFETPIASLMTFGLSLPWEEVGRQIFLCSILTNNFFPLVDTAEGIAGELISAGLVDIKDFIPVAQNLDRLIKDRAKMKNVVFPLVSFACLHLCFYC